MYRQVVINGWLLGVLFFGLLIEFQRLVGLVHLVLEHGIAQQDADVVGGNLCRLAILVLRLGELAGFRVEVRDRHV